MFHIALYEPEIPPNTGNIIRLCANTGAQLHLIHPLGFDLDEKSLRRAGLDHYRRSDVKEYKNFSEFKQSMASNRIFACSTKVQNSYADVEYQENDVLLFGPETRGLPSELLSEFPDDQKIRIPMKSETRSLNLSNAVSIILFEAWRQQGFS